MVTHNAEVIEKEGEHYLALNMPDNCLEIPITQDIPKDIQKVFNQLIVYLKNGLFEFSIEEDENGDIIYHVSKEYIVQLNSELRDIYCEMEDHGLVKADQEDL